jgi:cobalt-zinc-cadmium efflux system protein
MNTGHTDENSHGHVHAGEDGSVAGHLKFAIALLTITMVAEFLGGWLTGSLALMADAGHVFMDLFALGVSLVAATVAKFPATATRTYGWHRAEILAALLNGVFLFALSIVLFYKAWMRIQSPQEVLAAPMLVVAVLGLVVNVVIALRLHRHSGEDINLRSAYLHVLGDTGSSVGVIAAGIVIFLTGWTRADALISIGIALLIFVGSGTLIFKAGHVLLEGVPVRLSVSAVAGAILKVEGVKSVHDLHIWSVCSHIVSLSCHIHIDPESPAYHDRVVKSVADLVRQKFGIVHSTIQVDYESCGDELITQDMEHPRRED